MSDQHRVVVAILGEVACVRFNDQKIVDSANIEEMGEELFALVEKSHFKHLLLNFDGVNFMSSAALNKFIMLDKKVKQVGGVLRLCNLVDNILEVFSITSLDRVFDIRRTEKEAFKAFGISE
ncbi:MAG: STAS domain-containing protein [Planctomycetales bacterium]|nr:STAS domain-containing protein [Planctomycetales bacterium]